MDPDELQKPYVTQDTAIQLVWNLYGLKVSTISEMVSYDDRNFHIKVESDHVNPYIAAIPPEGFTLKVTNTLKSAIVGHFDSMHAVMRYLHRKGLRLPQPVTNLEGKTWAIRNLRVMGKGGAEDHVTGYCGVHLLTFLPGVPVSTLTYNKDVLHQWGTLLAKCQNGLQDFSNDVLRKKDIFWSLAHIPEIEKFVVGLDEEKTKMVLSVLRKFPEINKSLPLLRKGFIHGDFNENNVLVRKMAHGYEVDGILDLEDLHYGTYVWDVGLMLAYVSLGCDDIDPLEGIGHSLSGYLQIRTLNDAEMSVLKLCIASRLCQSLVIGAFNYRKDPTNSYLMTSSKTGWSRLKLIWETPNETLLKMWKNLKLE